MNGNGSRPSFGLPSAPISRTAVYVAAARAVGAREPDPVTRNPDRLVERFLGDASQLDVDHPVVHALELDYDDAMEDIEVVSAVRMMMVRTRFIDDALERAVADGATQIVILGAGLDTHAYRCRELLAGTRVFEVDRPSTQALKRRRVDEVLGGAPDNTTYVAVDFGTEDLADVLSRHGYDASRQTFFILEGVTMYLPEEAVRATLRFVAAHLPGSGIVFDFLTGELIRTMRGLDIATVAPAVRPIIERFLTLIRDEPFHFGIPFGTEREYLGELGLEIREVLVVGGEEAAKRYLTKADGTQVGETTLARAMARFAAAAPSVPVEQMREHHRMMTHKLAAAFVPHVVSRA
ncbi:MAG TPA: SAM-dependent methyltransferase [Gammaproteobacteria bacterium]